MHAVHYFVMIDNWAMWSKRDQLSVVEAVSVLQFVARRADRQLVDHEAPGELQIWSEKRAKGGFICK